MGLAFIGFGVGTLNLFMLFKANAELFAAYGGRQAIMDGGLQQLIELLRHGYASLAATGLQVVRVHAGAALSEARQPDQGSDRALEQDRSRD